ncbi:hypothetical protein Hthe01_20580 [Hydrogenophilus thermoluteolus]|uniref:hypothetical protein n=1 Tax=Hydrogenophilus thermoluteolus TaxID=297 RepID=UPI0024A2F652|nr:hypothetical protein [Hydrogenophilus thermoluteolus]GLW61709.1 hypothetical protein Hthe01_20580 [Hydrogenophilus thermoluteolus]
MKIRVLAAMAAVALIPFAHAADRYTNIKPLLLQAIDAPDGRAEGEIVGPIADKFRETTKSNAPIMVEVMTIKSFNQEGCKRLNVRVSQANVPTKEGEKITFAADYGINLCRDGSPPVEGMDLEQVGKMLELQEAE